MNLDAAWPYLEIIANKRIRGNQTDRHVDSPLYYGQENSTQYEILGAAGELAARRFLGLPEVLHEHFDGGRDFVYRNLLIDVKTTRLTKNIQYRFLQWPTGKPIKADVVLMTAIDLRDRKAIVIGYATKAEVLSAGINDARERPCHEIPISKLHLPWELVILDIPRERAE